MEKIYLIPVFLLISINVLNAQIEEGSHLHVDKNEIGAGIGYVNSLGVENEGIGFHLHYMRSYGPGLRLSLGPAFEVILDGHHHASANLSIGFRPLRDLYMSISPGASFGEGKNIEYITHFEVLYEFDINGIHIGPLFEYGVGQDERHIMLAFHIGYGF